jgi:hypothetical protein
MPTEELEASAYRKYDMEAWMPGRGKWGEVNEWINTKRYFVCVCIHLVFHDRFLLPPIVPTINHVDYQLGTAHNIKVNKIPCFAIH